MQGHYQPYAPPPGPPIPPPRRDGANLAVLFIFLGTVGVALLGTLVFVVAKVADEGDSGTPRTISVSSPSYNPRSVASVFAGTWTGGGYYYNSSGTKRAFEATLTLTEGSGTGSSSYTGFVCSGTLRVEEATSTKLVMYEQITQGNEPGGNCADAASGYITLTMQSDGSVNYAWYSTREKMLADNTASQANLTRGQTTTT